MSRHFLKDNSCLLNFALRSIGTETQLGIDPRTIQLEESISVTELVSDGLFDEDSDITSTDIPPSSSSVTTQKEQWIGQSILPIFISSI